MPTYYEAMYAGAGPEEDDGMVMGGAGAGVPDTQTTPQSSETPPSAMGSGRGSGKGRGESIQLGGSHRASNVERYDMWSEQSSGWSSGHDQNSEDRWSTGSQWERSSNENWSRHSDRAWRNYYVRDSGNWEWVKPRDGWHEWHHDCGGPRPSGVRGHDLGHREEVGGEEVRRSGQVRRAGECQGDDMGGPEEDPGSPISVRGRNVGGELPSGDLPPAGKAAEKPVAGDTKNAKISSSYPPIFRAKPGESYKEWKRAVGFWLGGEANTLPRLMVQLRDRAGQLVHHLSNTDVNHKDGMKVIMETLEKSPIIRQLDRHKVDQHRKKLMQLRRFPGESLESYVTRGSIYRTQLQALDHEMQMGECFYTGHLLDNAKLTRKDKVMVKTRAGSDYEEDITNAMIELAPELEGESGCPIGSSEPNAAARQGDEFLLQRSEAHGNRFGHRKENKDTYAMDLDGPLWEDPAEYQEETGTVLDGEDEQEIPELLQAEQDAMVIHHKAKQRIAEIRKLRQYFKKPDPEERRRLLAEKMKTSPCHRCGELGHWSRECPMKMNATGVTSSRSGATRGPTAEDDWAAMVALCNRDGAKSDRGYKTLAAVVRREPQRQKPCNEIRRSFVCGKPFEAFWSQQELERKVIVDLGCVKSVVGVKWMRALLTEWKAQQRWFRVCPEKEVFQFGNGENLTSRYAVQFEAIVAGAHVIINMSVVSGHCPPLLSRHACTQLGLSIDCGSHSCSSKKMNVKKFGLSQASNGHYLLAVGGFEDTEVADIPNDFKMSPGCEAWIVRPADSQRIESEESAPPLMSAQPRSVAAVGGGSVCGSEREEEGEGRASGSSGMPSVWRSRSPRAGVPAAQCGVRQRRDESGSRLSRGKEEEEQRGFRGEEPGLGDDSTFQDQEGIGSLREQRQGGRQPRVGHGERADHGGERVHCKEEAEDPGSEDEASHPSSVDRRSGRFSQSQPRLVVGGGYEHGVFAGIPDEGLPMEEVTLAAEGEG